MTIKIGSKSWRESAGRDVDQDLDRDFSSNRELASREFARASQIDVPVVAGEPRERLRRAPRMPPGVGGVNIDPPTVRRRGFAGDVAVKALRERLSHDPRALPAPPVPPRRDPASPWFGIFSFAIIPVLTAGLGLLVIWPSSTAFKIPPRVHADLVGAASPAAAPALVQRVVPPPTAALPARLLIESQRGVANEPLPLGVELAGGLGGETILLAGLIAGTKLTVGAPLGTTTWQVPGREVGKVLAYAPRDFIGSMDAVVDLRSANDRLVDSQILRLEWTPKQSPNAARELQVRIVPQAPLSAEELGDLFKRGREMLSIGDIATARLVLRRAAVGGSAEAALLLGSSFDPDVLSDLGVVGVAPDASQARMWYQRAVELGSPDAPRRIERLARIY